MCLPLTYLSREYYKGRIYCAPYVFNYFPSISKSFRLEIEESGILAKITECHEPMGYGRDQIFSLALSDTILPMDKQRNNGFVMDNNEIYRNSLTWVLEWAIISDTSLDTVMMIDFWNVLESCESEENRVRRCGKLWKFSSVVRKRKNTIFPNFPYDSTSLLISNNIIY